MNRLLKAETAVLTALLWPMVKIEAKINRGQFNANYGEPSIRQQVGAHIERWTFLATGIITVMVWPLLGIGIIIGVIMAIFIDPFIWARRAKKPIIEGRDFRMSAVVNSAILYMFAVGLIVGSVVNAVV